LATFKGSPSAADLLSLSAAAAPAPGGTAAISNQSADSIARAAEVHGENDDITVLTLRFAPDAETQVTEVFG
jgi:hypothetical protein